MNLSEYNINDASSSTDSLGHVQGPVCDIVSLPGVAGKTLGEERVVVVIGGTVLHQSARTGENNFKITDNDAARETAVSLKVISRSHQYSSG